jgi:hypothetical protein
MFTTQEMRLACQVINSKEAMNPISYQTVSHKTHILKTIQNPNLIVAHNINEYGPRIFIV